MYLGETRKLLCGDEDADDGEYGRSETPVGKDGGPDGGGGGPGGKPRAKTMPARFSVAAFPSPVLRAKASDGTARSTQLSRDSGAGSLGTLHAGTPGAVGGDDSPGWTPGVGGGEDGKAGGAEAWDAAGSSGGGERKLTAKERVFATFDDPDSSPAARYVSMLILSLILLSTTTFIMETRREYEGNRTLMIIETICIVVFTVEYAAKFATAPNRYKFCRGAMNLVDLVAILPFYLELVILAAASGGGGGAPAGLLRLFRLFRVFRVLKLGARMKKLEVVGSAVLDSMDMMGMLVFVLALALVLFSTLIYFCEEGVWEEGDALDAHGGDPFASIPRSFWWCMVTLMTVGYGDAYPVTAAGKIVASLTMIASVLITALPISVIGANFTQRWIMFKENDAAKARELTMHPTFVKLTEAIGAHNFVLDEVLRAVEEMEILIEQETARLKALFAEASEMPVETVAAREIRRGLLLAFDSRFGSLQDMREELEELLAFTELLSSSAFTSMLETCTNKNGRLVSVMDTCEAIFGDVDALVKKVNDVTVRGLDLSSLEGNAGERTYSRSSSGASGFSTRG